MPRPNVSSSVIRLDLYEECPVKVRDDKYMFRLIRASFNQRRKTLSNGLSNDSSLNLTRDKVVAALVKMGKPETVRGETFTLEDFAVLSDLLLEQ